ncbi:hypothetical protein CBL_01499 [Carabus blaptoides fortunei]
MSALPAIIHPRYRYCVRHGENMRHLRRYVITRKRCPVIFHSLVVTERTCSNKSLCGRYRSSAVAYSSEQSLMTHWESMKSLDGVMHLFAELLYDVTRASQELLSDYSDGKHAVSKNHSDIA